MIRNGHRREEQRWTHKPLRSAAGDTFDDAKGDGKCREHRQDAEEKHDSGHQDHRRISRTGGWFRPLPADGQLRPHGDAKREEDTQRTTEGCQAGSNLVAAFDHLPGEPRVGKPCSKPAPGDVGAASQRARSLADLGDEQFGELVAVAGAPVLRVPAEQALGLTCEFFGGFFHAAPQLRANRRSPTSATRRWAAR